MLSGCQWVFPYFCIVGQDRVELLIRIFRYFCNGSVEIDARTVHFYKTRQRNDMHLPKPKLALGKRKFSYSGAVLFNYLPSSIKEATSLPIFKNLLRLHLRQ